MRKTILIGLLTTFFGVSAFSNVIAAQQSVEVEVVFKDHWGKASDPVKAELHVRADGKSEIVSVQNSKAPLPDILKLAVVEVYTDGQVAVVAEEMTSRIVQIEDYASDNGQRAQIPHVRDMRGFEPHSVAVGGEFSVADGREVLSVIRRTR